MLAIAISLPEIAGIGAVAAAALAVLGSIIRYAFIEIAAQREQHYREHQEMVAALGKINDSLEEVRIKLAALNGGRRSAF
jgi:hypothetical protein